MLEQMHGFWGQEGGWVYTFIGHQAVRGPPEGRANLDERQEDGRRDCHDDNDHGMTAEQPAGLGALTARLAPRLPGGARGAAAHDGLLPGNRGLPSGLGGQPHCHRGLPSGHRGLPGGHRGLPGGGGLTGDELLLLSADHAVLGRHPGGRAAAAAECATRAPTTAATLGAAAAAERATRAPTTAECATRALTAAILRAAAAAGTGAWDQQLAAIRWGDSLQGNQRSCMQGLATPQRLTRTETARSAKTRQPRTERFIICDQGEWSCFDCSCSTLAGRSSPFAD